MYSNSIIRICQQVSNLIRDKVLRYSSKTKTLSVVICAVALGFSQAPLALASPAADKVIDEARANCKSFENGVLSMNEQAISLADISGDGTPDEIIDSSHFSCSTSASYFCGTGGCAITIIVGGKPTEFFAKGYKVTHWHNQPLLLLAVHGAACNGSGVRKCYEVHVWSEGAFRSPGAP